MEFGWPQLIYIALNFFGLGIILVKGKTESKFMPTLVAWVIITLPLLYWGGFFTGGCN